MNRDLVDRITAAVLYEGYLLYPYRASAIKNQQRWTFGGLYPPSYSEAQGGTEACTMQTECLLQWQEGTTLQIRVRFLHLQERTVSRVVQAAQAQAEGKPAIESVAALKVGDKLFHPCQEAVEREVTLPEMAVGDLLGGPHRQEFFFPPRNEGECLYDPARQLAGVMIRLQGPITGVVTVSAQAVADNVLRVTVRILNQTPLEDAATSRNEALRRSLVSTHTILHVRQGEFVSLLDPPDAWRELAAGCRNVGTWPVLVGAAGEKDTLLSSPIILYDYPQIAPESPGDLFDATEIDEILTLRILTMTEQEKMEVSAGDERGRLLLERTEALAREQLMNLHGAVRGLRPVREGETPAEPETPGSAGASPSWSWEDDDRRQLECIQIGAFELRRGDRVRLRPQGRADIFDLALDGKTATIAGLEQDYENQVFLAVTVDDDPGKDFGLEGQPGHRFFFRPDEIEPLGKEGEAE